MALFPFSEWSSEFNLIRPNLDEIRGSYSYFIKNNISYTDTKVTSIKVNDE